jgi:hypothetical protein
MIADGLGEIKERANRGEKDRFDHRRRLNVQSSTSNTESFQNETRNWPEQSRTEVGNIERTATALQSVALSLHLHFCFANWFGGFP